MEPNELITQLYVGYYNRAPDPEGLQYWLGRLAAGVSLADIADSFAASPEAISNYPYLAFPDVVGPEAFLRQIYLNLFNREIDEDGLEYYTDKLESGATTPGQIIAEIQANANTNPNNDDGQVLANKVEVGLAWAQTAANTEGFVYNPDGATGSSANSVLDNVTADEATVTAALDEVAQFFGDIENEGNTFTLTNTGAILTDDARSSAVVGDGYLGAGNDTVNAFGFGNGAVIQDSFTNDTDTLNVNVAGGSVVSPSSLENIEVINIRAGAAGAGAAAEFDASNVSGAEAIWSRGSSGPLNVTNVGEQITVGLAGSNNGMNVEFESGVYQDGDTVNFAVSGTNGNAYADLNADTGLGGAAEVSADIQVTGENRIDLGVNNGDNDSTNDADLVSITLRGAGNIALSPRGTVSQTFADVEVFDASELAGGVSVDLTQNTADITVTGSAATDYVNLGDVDGDDSIDLGGGDDILGLDEAELSEFSEDWNAEYLAINTADGTPGLAFEASEFGGVEGLILNDTVGDVDLEDFDDATLFVSADQGVVSFDSTDSASIQLGFPDIGEGAVNELLGRQTGATGAATTVTLTGVNLSDVAEASINTGADSDDTLAINTLTANEDTDTVTVSGEGNLTVGTLTADDLEIDLSGLTGSFSTGGSDNSQTFVLGDIGTSTIGLGGTVGAYDEDRDIVEFTTDFDSVVTINGFDAGSEITADLLDLSGLGIDSIDDLTFADAAGGPASVTITSDSFEGSIVLVGVSEAELDANNFAFGAVA